MILIIETRELLRVHVVAAVVGVGGVLGWVLGWVLVVGEHGVALVRVFALLTAVSLASLLLRRRRIFHRLLVDLDGLHVDLLDQQGRAKGLHVLVLGKLGITI